MRKLFEIDKKDYKENGTIGTRPSVRGVIRKGNKYALVYSPKYNYYKFPGGGIENGESMEDALIREVLEETGLTVIKSSIQEFGYVHRIQKGDIDDIFIQDNYYYLCDTTDKVSSQKLDAYEAEEGFCLRFVSLSEAIHVNENEEHSGSEPVMIVEREARVMRLLLEREEAE